MVPKVWAAIREDHRSMPVNTARVTAETPAASPSPVTGFGYLDSVLDQPGSVIAMAHRGGALHPEIPGTENTLHAFTHAVGARLPLPRDRRARDQRRGAARLPRRRARPGHRQPGRALPAHRRRDPARPHRRRARRAHDGRAARGSSPTSGSTSTSSRRRRCGRWPSCVGTHGEPRPRLHRLLLPAPPRRLPAGHRRPGGHLRGPGRGGHVHGAALGPGGAAG